MSEPNITENDYQPTNAPNARPPVFFYIMLVLSMVNAGMTFFSSIILGFAAPTIVEMNNDGTLPISEKFSVAVDSLSRIPQYYFFITALFWALSFYGALAMWKLRKTGFHCYTLAQLIILLLTVVILGKANLSLGDVMFTILFIAYYATVVFLWNKRQEQSQQNE
ncbi:MAG: hypothetical protein IK032_08165 [Bacteroidales bacterium]|nr:hypothetical protein [Bacteroidales bacterium]MBR5028794.1 hypothetical protein [Bacteroidales bacterium]